MNNNISGALSRPQELSRSLMRNVYVWMSLGLAITGFVSLGVANNPTIYDLFFDSGLFIVALIGEIALVFYLSRRIMSIEPMKATILFALYAILNGVTMSWIFIDYASESIASTFFITAGMFGAMSVFAFVTKRDLSGWGNYLFMALIGVIIATVVNIFLQSSTLSYIISYIGVVLFMGLTAYDTQQIKALSDELGSGLDEASYIRLSIIGALKLYLDFINMFLFLLRIFGSRD